jgi:hypothetical protein
MKKAGFFVVLGFALLGLFGCVSDGGGILVSSSDPTGQWEVWTLKDTNGDGIGDSLDQLFPVGISIVNDEYQAAVYEIGSDFKVPVEGIQADFDFEDPDVTFEIYREDGSGNFHLNMTGTLSDSSDNTEDYMFGKYDETVGDTSGQWIAVRINSTWYAEDLNSPTPTSGEGAPTLEEKAVAIEKILSEELGLEEVHIEIPEYLSENLK